MDDNYKTIALAAGVSFLCFIWSIILYIIYTVRKNTKTKLAEGSFELTKFKDKLNKNELTRSEIINNYKKCLLYYQNELKNYTESNNFFKSNVFPDACIENLLKESLELYRHVLSFLSDDISKYTEGEEKIKIEKTYKIFTHMFTDIMNKKSILIKLQIYSNYFVILLKMCSCINECLERRYKNNKGVMYHTNYIKEILNKYKPISLYFDGAASKSKEIRRKINEKYNGRIRELKNFYDIWEYTYFGIFDEIINFIGEFYTEIDSIKQIEMQNTN